MAYSTTNKITLNQKNSLFNIELYQCNTKFNTTATVSNEEIMKNLIDSCKFNCCTSNHSNKTTSSNVCQVTVRSSSNVCLGRLCYSGQCEQYKILANMLKNSKQMNKTLAINEIRSSFGTIFWSSIVNSTQIKWTSWIDRTSGTIRYTILISLLIVGISLTFATMMLILKSIRQSVMISDRRAYRYTLLS
ncbi:unnamed protein product [Adineta ricciae]|uniref:Uncharacterized protein n=1 Tax=Adineta ricciae TaxID=249248 RepID=A0A813ZGZ0_ADIRI|nr:unnamed protein product [Adineta ricciae]CAF1229823.1 unnamed protein product [Adineta ricciae]